MRNWLAAPSLGYVTAHLVSYSLAQIRDIVGAVVQRIHLTYSPGTSEPESLFFKLPAEMRQAIYEAAILDESESCSESEESTTSTGVNLLRTCRQVKMEAEPIRYQRPQSFASQAKFFIWVDRSRDSNLERVRTLTLHLTDVDLSQLMASVPMSPRNYSTAWSIYQAELERLDGALRSLPNINSLTIIPPKDSRSMLLRQFYKVILSMIPSRCPKLKRLELHDTEDVLNHTPTLKHIQDLVFTESRSESSATSPSEEEPTNYASGSSVVKLESNSPDGQPIFSSPSPKLKRRSRVTRVVSD